MAKRYRINEVYKSVQGEGHRAGSVNVFVRFSGCNRKCRVEPGPDSPGGFDCDTEFESGRSVGMQELLDWIEDENRVDGALPKTDWVIATGGEPLLQLDDELVAVLQANGWKVAIETNGTIAPPQSVDYVALSPKVAEHAVRCLVADELRYVRGYGQALPKPRAIANHHFISPTFIGNTVDERALEWCKQLLKGQTLWKLSIQQHKLDNVR